MKSLFNFKITKRIFISCDINITYKKNQSLEFNLFLLPSISIYKTSNDCYQMTKLKYYFLGWTKINFNWIFFNLQLSIQNKPNKKGNS